MTYQANIPQPTDILAQSQQDLLDNFGQIDFFTQVNHVAFNDPNQGKHKFLQMPLQASPPTTSSNEGGIFEAAPTNMGTVTESQMYYRRPNKTGAIDIGTKDLLLSGGLVRAYGVYNSAGSLLDTTKNFYNLDTATKLLNVYTVPFLTALESDNFCVLITPYTITPISYCILSRATTGFQVSFESNLTVGFCVNVIGGLFA